MQCLDHYSGSFKCLNDKRCSNDKRSSNDKRYRTISEHIRNMKLFEKCILVLSNDKRSSNDKRYSNDKRSSNDKRTFYMIL